jgi:hypothetical protein
VIRNVAAALAGLFTAFALIYLIELLGHSIYPPPEGLDQKDAEALRAYIALLPPLPMLFPMFAYFLGTFAGTSVGCLIGTARPIFFAAVVGMLVLAGTIANLIYIPHPLWFSIIAPVGIVVSAWLAMVISPRGSSLRTPSE